MEQQELINACKQNDLKAQMQVYEMYKDMLYNVSYRIIRDEHSAKGAVHDAFIKAFQNMSKLGDDIKLGPWLKRIVVNCSLDFLRQKKKLGWIQESFEFTEATEPGEETEAYEDITFKVQEVKKAISNLKDKYRIVIVLYLIEEYSHREIAEQLGLKEGTVRNQYVRGKRLLEQELQKRGLV